MFDQTEKNKLLQLVNDRHFRDLRVELQEMNEVDIADFLDELSPEHQVMVFRLLPKEVAAEVFAYLEDSQEKLIGALSDRELREVLDDLYLDDTVDLIEDMPAKDRKSVV